MFYLAEWFCYEEHARSHTLRQRFAQPSLQFGLKTSFFLSSKKNPQDAVKRPPCKEQEASKLISANTAEIVQL